MVHESADGDPAFERAREVLREAERVCFLGCAFHPVNMERLRVKELRAETLVHGTAYRLEPAEAVEALTLFQPQPRTPIYLEPKRCLEFLRGWTLLGTRIISPADARSILHWDRGRT